MRSGLFLLLLPLLLSVPAIAEPLRFSSGVARTSMIELYTSEGCNSCPSTEVYLNSYAENPALWRRYVPMAFHVDYWDYLGWKDRFASAKHTRRQRAYARWHRSATVYTPAVFVNGDPLPPGRIRIDGEADTKPVGDLRVRFDGDELTVRFVPATRDPLPEELHVAVLGMGLTSDIRAGENRGRHSRHEFVVLAHQKVVGDDGAWRMSLPSFKDLPSRKLALAVWVAHAGIPAPVQATGGYLP